jgi:hypothetical protein
MFLAFGTSPENPLHKCNYTIIQGKNIYHTCYYEFGERGCVFFKEHDTRHHNYIRICSGFKIINNK